MTTPALRQLMGHGGSAAAWLARDRAVRQRLGRAEADASAFADARDWDLLLQAPLANAEPAVQTLLDVIGRGAAEIAAAGEREPGVRLAGGARAGAAPRRSVAPAAGTAAAAGSQPQPMGLVDALARRFAPAGGTQPRAPVEPAVGPLQPSARPASQRHAGATDPLLRVDAAAVAAQAQWRRRAADAGLSAAFDHVVGSASAAAAALLQRPGSGLADAIAGRAAAPPSSATTRLVDALARISGGIDGGMTRVADVAPQPPARRGGSDARARTALDAFETPQPGASAQDVQTLQNAARGGFRGLAERAAQAAAADATPALPATPARDPAAGIASPRTAAPAEQPEDARDDDLADRLARILRRAAERDGVDLDDVQPS